MKKKLLKSLAIAGGALVSTIAPIAALTSCGCSNRDPDAKKYNVALKGQKATINKIEAYEGETFLARISASRQIVKITNVYVNDQAVTLDYYSYSIVDDGINCDIAIRKEAIFGDIIIEVQTRTNTNDLLFSVTDDIDNKGLIVSEGEQWIDKEAAYAGVEFTFTTAFPISTYGYPVYEPSVGKYIWKSCVNVQCGNSWLSPGAYEIENVAASYSTYKIKFFAGYINDDVTIHLDRLIYVTSYNEEDKMFYYNPVWSEGTVEAAFFIRGKKADADGIYYSSLAPGQKLSYTGLNVYVGDTKLDEQDYEWKPVPDESGYYVIRITVFPDVALDNIKFEAKYDIL